MGTEIVVGSLSDVSEKNGQSLAESFVDAEAVVIVDVSGSMSERDSRGGRERYEIACEELAALQGRLPGKVAVIAFSDSAVFCPGGKPPYMGVGTDLAGALSFAKIADVSGIRFFVISDGEPDNREKALQVAGTVSARIDTIYVGPEASPFGRDFLQELASRSGGQSVTADRAQDLASETEKLLLIDSPGCRQTHRDNARWRAPQRSENPLYQ